MIVDIVTSDQLLYSGEASFVAAPAANGEIGILESAAPIMSTLRLGEVRVKSNETADQLRFAVSGGYFESDGHKIVVLANRAIDVSLIDKEICRQRIEKYEKRLADATAGDSRIVYYKEEISWQQYLSKLVGKD